MTKYTTVGNVGPVQIIQVDAEFIIDVPTKFNCDCTECGWGFFSTSDAAVARMEAQAHLDRGHQLYDKYDDVTEG